MALLAFDFGVAAGQHKTRFVMVVLSVLPTLLVVAGLAFVAKLPFVLVIFLVAADAFAVQSGFEDLASLCGMARVTLEFRVTGLQGIFRLAVMIEDTGLPALRGMTGFTLVAKAPLVPLFVIILAVTGNALPVQFQFDIRSGNAALVATFALGVLVLVAQGKASRVMVES